MKTVNVGVFGTSWWADTMYLPPLDNHPGAKVAAVCGRNPATTAAFAATWNVPASHTDAAALFDGEDLDAVVIATANNSHHELAIAALKRGLHVLCEKPMALNVEQATEMYDAAETAGVITMMPFTYHWMPSNPWPVLMRRGRSLARFNSDCIR